MPAQDVHSRAFDLQGAKLLPRILQYLGVVLVVGAATHRLLANEEFKAVVICRAEIDLCLAPLTELKRHQWVSQRLSAQTDHICVAPCNVLRTVVQQGAVFGAHCLKFVGPLVED